MADNPTMWIVIGIGWVVWVLRSKRHLRIRNHNEGFDFYAGDDPPPEPDAPKKPDGVE